jgi:hypothetical protein
MAVGSKPPHPFPNSGIACCSPGKGLPRSARDKGSVRPGMGFENQLTGSKGAPTETARQATQRLPEMRGWLVQWTPGTHHPGHAVVRLWTWDTLRIQAIGGQAARSPGRLKQVPGDRKGHLENLKLLIRISKLLICVSKSLICVSELLMHLTGC